ncbi:MAG: peptide chain release factor N(5)-glutamine methyltransferase [Parafilimonas sp.]
MTVFEANKTLIAKLLAIYTNREATNIAAMVIEKITGFTKTQRLINKENVLTTEQEDQLKVFTEQLLVFRPVQYVLNEAWFAGMNFYVDENVLIPRPETEELVELIIAQSINKKYSILDIGTGSGCIAVALKKKIPLINVYALDISNKCLEIARQNANKNNVFINFLQADILNLNAEINARVFDVIVSNPPYIKQSESIEMFANVLKYEPHIALFVNDDDPLIFYKAIADFGLKNLKADSGKLFFEINEAMSHQVAGLLAEKGYSAITITKDLQAKDRIVSAVLR